MSHANAAIYFHPEGYQTRGARLMGRQAAGEGFLRAYFRFANPEVFYCYTPHDAATHEFTQLRDAFAPRPITVRPIPFHDLAALAEPGLLYYPAPGIAELAWRRRRVGEAAYSLCGVTHTIASHSAMDSLANLLLAPVFPWDAIICTSRVVVRAVERLLEAEEAYLTERLGATQFLRPQLPMIPLGADCDALRPDPASRAAWRSRLGIAENEVAFLFVGRLSFHAKANPYPMYLALERAARRVSVKLHLIQAGWFANEKIQEEFSAAARAICPSVAVSFLDGRDSAVRSGVWHAADLFTSLSDNVQETFGLTPIEAKAAGLPCVVSDWNGYCDTVREGEDGFRIPTTMPAAPAGELLARRHADEFDSYDRYIGQSSLSVSVDVAACAEAYVALAGDPERRRRMGEAASAHARAEFDWPVILRRYQELWDELAVIRQAGRGGAAAYPPQPRRADPFWLFAEYANHLIQAEDRFALSPGAGPRKLQELLQRPMLNYGMEILAAEADLFTLLERLARRGAASMAEIAEELPASDPATLARTLGWLLKLDLIRRVG